MRDILFLCSLQWSYLPLLYTTFWNKLRSSPLISKYQSENRELYLKGKALLMSNAKIGRSSLVLMKKIQKYMVGCYTVNS